QGHRLTGERAGRVFRLGDPLRVKLAGVNVEERKIDFILDAASAESPCDSPAAPAQPRAKKRRSKAC
ncbi:MAG: hypothetical protein WCP34_13260, partial [Pseudomonadota bacterium]